MATPNLALFILSILALILTVFIPLLNAIPKLSRLISMRWTCVAIVLLIMVGVIVDFEPLADNTRDIALIGGFIIVGSYLLFRTVEKIMANGWLKGVNVKGNIEKDGWKGGLEVSSETSKEESSEESKELSDLPESQDTDEK